MTYYLFRNRVVLNNFFVYLYIEIFPLIVIPLPILLLVQLLECIWLVRKEVSSYYYVIIAFYMSFFKPSRDPQILFIFQFNKPLSSQYAYPRPINNSLYRCLVLNTFQYISSLVQFLLLLYNNSFSKFSYSFFQFLPCEQILKVILLLNLSLFNGPYLCLEILVLQDS